MPKKHFVEGNENFGGKLGRFLWSFNGNLNSLMQSENLFSILEGIRVKIKEWDEKIKELEMDKEIELNFLNLKLPEGLNIFEIVDGLIFGGKELKPENQNELEKIKDDKEKILIGYNKIYENALIIVNYIFKEKESFDRRIQEGGPTIQLRYREGEKEAPRYTAIEKSAKESFNLHNELAIKLKKGSNTLDNSFEIIEKIFLKVKGGLMRFGFMDGIKKENVLMKWNENEQSAIIFEQLTDLNLILDNQNVSKTSTLKFFIFYNN
uniref:Uncharacterized protein n=1 Tax=Meloidogyne hapla TaxID=6305 RepID=A0A1I8B6T9_MELHA